MKRRCARRSSPPRCRSLHIAPSTIDLAGLELEIGQARDRAFRLRNALAPLNDAALGQPNYSYVLVDCPPSLNLLTVNAMAAANADPGAAAMRVLRARRSVATAQDGGDRCAQQLNPGTHDPRHRADDVRCAQQSLGPGRRRRARVHGRKVYDTIIPRNVRVSEAPSYGKPVLVYDLKCSGSEAYLRLATEIIQREKELCAG